MKKPVVDYREFRLSRLNEPRFAHLKLLAGWILTVITAYFAVVISAALLNGKRFNGLLSFVLFLALSWFIGWVARIATASIPSINVLLLVDGAIYLAFTAVMYVITAIIMERKLSV